MTTRETLEQISKRDSLQRSETFLEQDNHRQQWLRKMSIWCRTIYKAFRTSMPHNNLLHHFSKTNLTIWTVWIQTQFKEPLNNNKWEHFSQELNSLRTNLSTVLSIQEWLSKKTFSKCPNKFQWLTKSSLRISKYRNKQVQKFAIRPFWQLISSQLSKLNRKRWSTIALAHQAKRREA